jgi:hypothetical protein
MSREETDLRASLRTLAAQPGGRRLLQLALRSLESGNHELVSGCWTSRGDAGCLFQHAYWQGVTEGVFADDGRARAWVSGVAGPRGYHLVIDVIAAFDGLARADYAIERRRFGPPVLDRAAWRATIAAMLVEVLSSEPAASTTVELVTV